MVTASTKLHSYLVALGVLGITTIFLPFTYHYSPFIVIVGDPGGCCRPLAAPAFLAIPISIASVIRLSTGRLWRLAWGSAYALALGMAGTTLHYLGPFLYDMANWSLADYPTFLSPLAMLALGAGCLIRNWRYGLPHALNAVIAMQVAYIADGVLCLVMFFKEDLFTTGWEIGAYMTLMTVVVYLVDILSVSTTRTIADTRLNLQHANEK